MVPDPIVNTILAIKYIQTTQRTITLSSNETGYSPQPCPGISKKKNKPRKPPRMSIKMSSKIHLLLHTNRKTFFLKRHLFWFCIVMLYYSFINTFVNCIIDRLIIFLVGHQIYELLSDYWNDIFPLLIFYKSNWMKRIFLPRSLTTKLLNMLVQFSLKFL